MKTIEENAKVYTELINRLEDVKDAVKKHNYGIAMEILCKPYTPFKVITHSELTESEDERIIKELICFLETEIPQCNARDKYIAWLKKQGEQTSTKVEPKFRVGDLVVTDKNNVTRIKSIDRNYYVLENTMRFTIDYVDKCWHLWTIQDAKDGDVLAVENVIFIYKRTLAHHIVSYCKLINDVFESTSDVRTCCEGNSFVHPATKEQRDTLMKAMTNAGFEWDAEKKELKKIEWTKLDNSIENVVFPFNAKVKNRDKIVTIIDGQLNDNGKQCIRFSSNRDDGFKVYCPNNLLVEQKSAERSVEKSKKNTNGWDINDEKNLEGINVFLTSCTDLEDPETWVEWIKTLKNRLQIKSRQVEPKQEWSEEDEEIVTELIGIFESAVDGGHVSFPYRLIKDYIRVLKSCLSQNTWKPSDEQMEALEHFVRSIGESDYASPHDNNTKLLYSLLQDLKKLKG